MSKSPKPPLAGGVPSWPIRLNRVAPHCPEKVYIGRSEAEILGYAISCYHHKVTRNSRQPRRVPMWCAPRVKGRKKTLCLRRYRGSVKVRWFHLCSPHSPLTLPPKTSTLPLPATKALISPHPVSWNLPSNSDVIPFPQNQYPSLVFQGTEYNHEGQKTSKRNLEKENPIICHSVEEGEEN